MYFKIFTQYPYFIFQKIFYKGRAKVAEKRKPKSLFFKKNKAGKIQLLAWKSKKFHFEND